MNNSCIEEWSQSTRAAILAIRYIKDNGLYFFNSDMDSPFFFFEELILWNIAYHKLGHTTEISFQIVENLTNNFTYCKVYQTIF